MKPLIFIFALLVGSTPLVVPAQTAVNKKSCTPCEQLKNLRLPDVTILKMESLANDTIKHQEFWLPTEIISVPFCRVLGKISKEINFELLLPQQWNGRFLMAGNGGFGGSIQNSLRNYINAGYAIVATDTGHEGNSLTADWAFNNMERQINFGRLAVHRTAVVSKSLISTFYCSDPAYSYFVGCSRGGGQAMVEAQLYPEDFNGIVAGAPAYSWPALGAKFIQSCQNIYPDPKDLSKKVLTNDNLRLLQEHVIRQCDNLDGVSDQILNDPGDCHFDFSRLPVCPNNKAGADCFTQEQIAVIKSIYGPLRVGDKTIYPGFPFGLEGEQASWDFWITGTSQYLQNAPSLHYMFGTNMFKYMVYNDPSWDYTKYDFKNFYDETRYASAFLDATQTDYSAFKNLKGKMIMYHGWNDAAISAYSTIQHFEEAMKKDKDLQSYIRLFMLPGVLHCDGGKGPDKVDWVLLIQEWVENDKAPERVVFSKIEKGKTVITRPVFPYPKVTMYSGKGEINLEKNFKAKGN